MAVKTGVLNELPLVCSMTMLVGHSKEVCDSTKMQIWMTFAGVHLLTLEC